MSEKRFSKCKDMWKVFDWETSETLNFKEIINLLNELAEENKELKGFIKSLCDKNDEIWLDDGSIYRLRKVFKGEWVK